MISRAIKPNQLNEILPNAGMIALITRCINKLHNSGHINYRPAGDAPFSRFTASIQTQTKKIDLQEFLNAKSMKSMPEADLNTTFTKPSILPSKSFKINARGSFKYTSHNSHFLFSAKSPPNRAKHIISKE